MPKAFIYSTTMSQRSTHTKVPFNRPSWGDELPRFFAMFIVFLVFITFLRIVLPPRIKAFRTTLAVTKISILSVLTYEYFILPILIFMGNRDRLSLISRFILRNGTDEWRVTRREFGDRKLRYDSLL